MLLQAAQPAQAERRIYDQPVVNGHPGYITAWEVTGPLDKVFIMVAGFDLENNDHPQDKLYSSYQPVIDEMAPDGWDIIYFDYVDGGQDLNLNADNLARFIEYLDTQAAPGYHLAVMGGSMGGIVTRTMFAREGRNLGVETFVTVDSPHGGVWLSEWVEDIAAWIVDAKAGHQMLHGDEEHDRHYGWLRVVEGQPWFMEQVIDPMHTLAIALSDGTQGWWDVNWDDLSIHTKYYPVSSYVSGGGQTTNYIPYHSAVYLADGSTEESVHWGYTRWRYRNLGSRYFDVTVPNPRTEHSAPEFAFRQTIDFVQAHGREPTGAWLIPLLHTLLQ